MRARYLVGIDPGLKTGIAVWDREERRLVSMTTTDFWGCVDVFRQKRLNGSRSRYHIFVEDPNKKKPIFFRGEEYDRRGDSAFREKLKIAQNVGANKREASLLIEYLTLQEFRVESVTPTGKKWSAREFKLLTKWEGRTSQHARDAAKLVFGRV